MPYWIEKYMVVGKAPEPQLEAWTGVSLPFMRLLQIDLHGDGLVLFPPMVR